MTLQEAKERVRIPDLWREFGFEGEPKKTCKCHFHEDRTPSFSVFNDGKAWKCFSGCGEGDAIDFLAKAKGLSNEEACREFLKRAGGHREPVRQERPKPEQAKLELPKEIPYSTELAQHTADSRGLRITSVNYAAIWLETLKFGRVYDQDCWTISDGSRKCAEARRIDRKPFPAIGTLGERKSHTLAGSRKSWPVGLCPPFLNENTSTQEADTKGKTSRRQTGKMSAIIACEVKC
jgi:CHC2 zinc finger